MPALSPTMTEGNLAQWLKNEGDPIKSGDVIAEIETDKATMEVEAVDEGTLGKILVHGGTEGVKVNAADRAPARGGRGHVRARGAGAGGAPAAAPPAGGGGGQPTEAKGYGDAGPVDPAVSPARARGQRSAPTPSRAAATAGRAGGDDRGRRGEGDRIFASPLARRMAEQAGLDLAKLKGTGPHGRIVKADIEAARRRQPEAAAQPTAAPAAAAAAAAAPAPARPPAVRSRRHPARPTTTEIPLTNMRKVIARRLTEAKQTIPHFYLALDIELDALLAMRAQLNGARQGRLQALGQRLRHQGDGAGAAQGARAATRPGAATRSSSTRTSTSRSRWPSRAA